MDENIFKFYVDNEEFKFKLSECIDKTEELISERRKQIQDALSKRNYSTLKSITSKDLNKEQRETFKSLLNFFTLIYSYKGVRLDTIYNRSNLNVIKNGLTVEKKQYRYNSSDPNSIEHLYNAVKFLFIANLDWLSKLNYIDSEQDRQILNLFIICSMYKLSSNFNISMTFNNNREIIYEPLNKYHIVTFIENIRKDVLENKRLTVYNLKGESIDLNKTKNKMKKMTKNKLEEYIVNYEDINNETPTLTELREFINQSVISSTDYSFEEKKSLLLNRDSNLRYYINEFELDDKIKQVYKKKVK